MSKFDEYGYNVSEFESFNDFESLENEKRSWRIKIENKIDDAETRIKKNTNNAKDEINNNISSSTAEIKSGILQNNGDITNKINSSSTETNSKIADVNSTVKNNESYLKKILNHLKIDF